VLARVRTLSFCIQGGDFDAFDREESRSSKTQQAGPFIQKKWMANCCEVDGKKERGSCLTVTPLFLSKKREEESR